MISLNTVRSERRFDRDETATLDATVVGARDETDILAAPSGEDGYFSALISQTFLSGVEETKAVLFTSADPGAGVTLMASLVSQELVQSSRGPVLLISAQVLETLRLVPSDQLEKTMTFHKTASPDLVHGESLLQTSPQLKRRLFKRSTEDLFGRLRANFPFIIVDAPSLKASDSALRLGPICDSVVLVVESGITRKDKIDGACRRLHSARARIAGLVCNKRVYQIPDWVFRRL